MLSTPTAGREEDGEAGREGEGEDVEGEGRWEGGEGGTPAWRKRADRAMHAALGRPHTHPPV